MTLRFCVVNICLLVFTSGASLALAQQDAKSLEKSAINTPISPLNQSEAKVLSIKDTKKIFVDRLDLKMYEAASGDLSLCADDQQCISKAKIMKAWFCAASACDGNDKSIEPIDCLKNLDNHESTSDLLQINRLICPYLKTPNIDTRRALLSHMQTKEDKLVEIEAYLLALKGSAVSCENYIKDYVGAYGSNWNLQWYRAMSGCNILAGKTTVKQEEADIGTYIGVTLGSGQCSSIVNSEMRKSCDTPGTTLTMISSLSSSLRGQ